MPTANVTIEELLPRLEQIRDEVEISANTATRVGQCMIDMLSLIQTGTYVTLNTTQTVPADKIFDGSILFGSSVGCYDPEDGDTASNNWMLNIDGSGFFYGTLQFFGNLHGPMHGNTGNMHDFWYIHPDGSSLFDSLIVNSGIYGGEGRDPLWSITNLGDAYFDGNVTVNGTLIGTATNSEKLGGKTYAELMQDIDDVYVSKAWLREVFRVFEYHGDEVIGNDIEVFGHGDVREIQFLYGIWSNEYVSALGKNNSGSSGGGSATTLRELLDTDIPTSIGVGKVLGWNGRYWVPVDSLNTTTLANYLTTNGYLKSTDLSSYATKAYVDNLINGLASVYVKIEWFRKLFLAFSESDIEVAPNASGDIDNIRAMAGLWTNQFLSALGKNDDAASGGGAATLAELLDTNIPDNVPVGQVLGWDGQYWRPYTALDENALANYLNSHGFLVDTAIRDMLSDYMTTEQALRYAADNFYNKQQINGFTWWGQSLSNGVVTGAMTGVTSIDGYVYFANNRVGIGTSSPAQALHLYGDRNLQVDGRILLKRYLFMNPEGEGIYLLNNVIHTHNNMTHVASGVSFAQSGATTWYHEMTVNGLLTANANIKTASYIDIGSVRIQYDSSQRMLKVVNTDGTPGSLYATGGLSALGGSPIDGSGGGGADLPMVWASLRNDDSVSYWDDLAPYRNYKIALAHLPANVVIQSSLDSTLSSYLTKQEAATDYLTKSAAAATYLTASDAAYQYLKKTDAAATYLTQTAASNTYLTKAAAASTYLTIANAASTYVTLSTNQTITGTKTFTHAINGNLNGTASNASQLEGHASDYFVNRFTAQSVGGSKSFTAATTVDNTLYVSQRMGIGLQPDENHSLVTTGSILSNGSLHAVVSVISDGDYRIRTASKSVRMRYDETTNTIWFDGGSDTAPVNVATYGGVSALGVSGQLDNLEQLTVKKLTIGDSELYPTADAPGVSRFTTATGTIYGTLRLRNSCFIAGNIHLDADNVNNNAHFYTSGKEIYVWFGNAVNRTNQTLYKLTKTTV